LFFLEPLPGFSNQTLPWILAAIFRIGFSGQWIFRAMAPRVWFPGQPAPRGRRGGAAACEAPCHAASRGGLKKKLPAGGRGRGAPPACPSYWCPERGSNAEPPTPGKSDGNPGTLFPKEWFWKYPEKSNSETLVFRAFGTEQRNGPECAKSPLGPLGEKKSFRSFRF